MSDFVPYIIGAILWFGCGAYAAWLDHRDFPNPVVPGADELLSLVLVWGGPVSLFVFLIMRDRGLKP